jgi:HlyD family secretion protein
LEDESVSALMKKLAIAVLALALGGAYYMGYLKVPSTGTTPDGAVTEGQGGRGGRRGGGNRGGGGGGDFGGFGGFRGGGGGNFGPRQPMTVEVTKVVRASISSQILVVGNLIGDATVSVVPRAAGRLQEISVKLGDRVKMGQPVAKIEDFEVQEQVKQAEAALEVSQATIRQREADLKLAETSVERSRSLYQRQLLPKQTLDDNEARYQSSLASLDLARAQHSQSKARLDELRINLSNTIITSPVDGFVARRAADPGAFASQNQPVIDVVDIGRVRLVANIVEKDLTQLQTGNAARVEVDAFPGETFAGRIARVAPVLDPATRTAPIEIEIPNPGYRLKPGMYARVGIVTNTKKDALVLPGDSVVDLGGRRGVFIPQNDAAVFRVVQVGGEQQNQVEILDGIEEGATVITTGARALRDGDRILLPGADGAGEGGRGRRGGGAGTEAGGGYGRRGGSGDAGDTDGASRSTLGAGGSGGAGSTEPEGGRRYGGAGEGGRRSGGYGQGGQRSGGEGEGRRGGGARGVPGAESTAPSSN